MKGISPVSFFNRAQKDQLEISHICLYLTLFWLTQRALNPEYIVIYRRDIMKATGIKSAVTYHKCLKELCLKGYLQYFPSYNYYQGSRVKLLI
jgi:hypothetical protein